MWMDRRIQWNGAIYQEDWNNAQIDVNAIGFISNNGVSLNGGNYRVRGVETSGVARVTTGLTVRRPAAPASWQGVRSAAAFGNRCPQIDVNGLLTGDEDCLTLNIFAVNPPASSKQPVTGDFHGGGERMGSAQDPPWNAVPPLASHGVIVVTVEYRLGLLGWLAHPLLTAEGQGSSGNYGLMDLIAALKWVHDNIAEFGGDPAKVMIFGQLAGAENIYALLASPAAAGLSWLLEWRAATRSRAA